MTAGEPLLPYPALPVASASNRWLDKSAAAVLALAQIAVVIVALPYKVFELDRYFVPKELVLHVAALVVAVMLVARRHSLTFDIVDGLIAFFLLWSVASAIFATNHWIAQ